MKKICVLFFIFNIFFNQAQNICFKGVDDYSFLQNYNSGSVSSLSSSAIADFNGDGHKDVAVSGYGSFVLLYFGNSTGVFPPSVLMTVTNISVRKMIAKDFDNNGTMDIAVYGQVGANYKVQILYGDGAGNFTSGAEFTMPIQQPATSFESADFNNDGHSDFLFSQGTTAGTVQTVYCYMNSSSGALTLQVPYTWTGTEGVITSDYNNDGNADIIMNGYGIAGNGLGGFAGISVPIASAPIWIGNMVMSDINSDGMADALYTCSADSVTTLFYQLNTGFGFSNTYTINCTDHPENIQTGDFNGDGFTDIVVDEPNISSVEILKNNGSGSFGSVGTVEIIQQSTPYFNLQYGFSVSDLNNDGRTDIACPGEYNPKMTVILGRSNSDYPSKTVVRFRNFGTTSKGIATGDFNNDGNDDFALAGPGVQAMMGTGVSTFTLNTTGGSGALSGPIYTEDFNNDGFEDLLFLTDLTNGWLAICQGQASGAFNAPNLLKTNTTVVVSYSDAAVADFDNDGIKDIITANVSPAGYSVLKGIGSFSFQNLSTVTYSVQSKGIVPGDFNNDGNMDFATVGFSTLSVWLGNGNCTFQSPIAIALPSQASFITSGNFNGDSFMDLAVCHEATANTLHILKGLGTGAFSINQSIPVSGSAGTDLVSEDLNGDGIDEVVASFSSSNNLNNLWIGAVNSSNNFIFKKYTVAYPRQIGFADVNKDGRRDILTTDAFANTGLVHILYNSTPGIGAISSNYSICPGGVAFLSVPTNYNISWNTSSTTNSIMITSPGIYTVTSSNFSGSCVSSATFVVNTSTTPVTPVTITNTNTSLCKNGSAVGLTSNPPGGIFTGAAVNTNSFFPALTSTLSNMVYATYTNSNSCISMDSLAFVVNPSPVVFAGNDTMVCNKSVIKLKGSGTAISYTWNNLVIDNTPFVTNTLPVSGTDYVVTGVDAQGCTNSDTINVKPDVNCNTVWPGDVNVDGTVTTQDFLVLGLGYGASGVSRSVMGDLWGPHDSFNWNTLIPSTFYTTCFLDCNGDGTINLSDTLAINLNFGLTHLVRPAQGTGVSTTNANIYFQFDKTSYVGGDTVVADIYLGSSTNTLNIYGTSFDFSYDNSQVKPGSEKFSFCDSWIGAQNSSMIKFGKLDTGVGFGNAALVKITHNDTSGYGKIARLELVLKDSLNPGNLILSITNAFKMDKLGNLNPLVSGQDSVTILNSAIGVNELESSKRYSIYPNPTSSYVYVRSSSEIGDINIYDILGNKVFSSYAGSNFLKISLDGQSPGLYFLEVNGKKVKLIKS